MEFMEQLLDLPPAWDMQQQIIAHNSDEVKKLQDLEAEEREDAELAKSSGTLRANVSNRQRPYEEYIRELTKEELDLLYTVYYHDFNIYGYDPCEGL